MTESMRILLQRYSEHFVLTHPMAITAPDEHELEDGTLVLPPIEMTSGMDSMHMTGVGLTSSRHILSNSVLSRPSPYSHSFNSSDQLGKLLTINRMGMQRREKTL